LPNLLIFEIKAILHSLFLLPLQGQSEFYWLLRCHTRKWKFWHGSFWAILVLFRGLYVIRQKVVRIL